jgi:hypothetical protein
VCIVLLCHANCFSNTQQLLIFSELEYYKIMSFEMGAYLNSLCRDGRIMCRGISVCMVLLCHSKVFSNTAIITICQFVKAICIS